MMRKFFQFLLLTILLATLVSLAVMLHYRSAYPDQPGPHFDALVRTVYRDNIETLQPQVVLMGDSTLRESVDFDQLSQALGAPTYGIAIPGSASALWYLILKNNIIQAAHKPQYLVLFTRETILTTPEFRVDGLYFATIDEFAGRDERLLWERSYVDQMNPFEQLVARYLPLYGEREQVRGSLDYRVAHTLPLLFGCNEDCVSTAQHSVFSGDVYIDVFLNEQDMVEGYLWRTDKLLFERQLKRSYLPEMVRMAQENGIQLILVEVKTWFSPGSTTTALLWGAYQRQLQAYAAIHGIPFVSFADDPLLPQAYFFDHLHLKPEAIPVFTELLAQELKPLLQ